MNTAENKQITVSTIVRATPHRAWSIWTDPTHIVQWNNASDDWHTPHAENDLREGGKFLSTMASKDGKMSFDFEGVYSTVIPNEKIEYAMSDGRKVSILFEELAEGTKVTESFDPENQNPIEMQRDGWQAIIDNYKKHIDNLNIIDTMHFEITINASAEHVYKCMLDEELYKEWTSAFHPTSRYQGKWAKGEKMLFLGDDGEGGVGGMVSRIKDVKPNEFVSIEHLGIYNNGQEITTGLDVELWANSLENYTFSSFNGKTLLSIDVDTNQEYKEMFSGVWPKALEKLKVVCER